RAIRVPLLAALDDWAYVSLAKEDDSPVRRRQLLAVARLADSDPWRNRLREAIARRDKKGFTELVDGYLQTADLAPATLAFVAQELVAAGAGDKAEAVLRKAQQQHPADFWINYQLAVHLQYGKPPQSDAAIGYLRAALALRPNSPGP